MDNNFVNLTIDNIDKEHICCAISDKKHQDGVLRKKDWLKEQLIKGHVFRKLNQNGKVFIEYGNLEEELVPVIGDNYIYIYCLWVSGSFKGKGYGKDLLEYAIKDAKEKGKNGICIISSNKKQPFLSDKKFLINHGFKVVDTAPPYFELLALSFCDKIFPKFSSSTKLNQTTEDGLVIYYNDECPYINYCLKEINDVCIEKNIKLKTYHINDVNAAKNVPSALNNFCVFYNGKFITHELLNKNKLLKILNL